MTFYENATANPSQALILNSFSRSKTREVEHTHIWSFRDIWFSIASVIVFIALAFSRWLLNGTIVPWDSKNQFYAFFRFLGDALQHGEIPLWNPYHFGGHPAIADPQSLIFTPSMLLFAWLAPRASMQAFDGVVMAHLLLGGVGILAYFHFKQWHPAGAVLAAVIFILGGSASARLQHVGMIISYSYFPFALWSLELALKKRSFWLAVLFGLFASLMALGRDQVAFLLCAILAGRVIWSIAGETAPWSYFRQRWGLLIVGFGLIVLILFIPSLLTMQFLSDSNRPGISYGVAAAGSLAPVNLITLFVPNFFGSLDQLYDYWGPGYTTMPQADFTDRAVNYLFIGTLPILLIAWHGCAGGRLFERRIRFFSAVLILALLYALGRYTPFFSIVFDFVPGISLYRRPADSTFLINIALGFGAGYLLHRYVKDGLPRPHLFLTKPFAFALGSLIIAGIACLIATGLSFSFREHRLDTSLFRLAQAIFLALSGIVLIYLMRDARHRALAASIFVMLASGELLWRNAASSLNAEPLSRYSIYSGMTPGEAGAIKILQTEIAAKTAAGDHPRVEILGLSGVWQNASMVLKLEDTLGYNPLRIDDYERAVGSGENAVDMSERRFPGTFRGYKCHLAALLGVEYLVLGEPLMKLPHHIPRPSPATLIYSGDNIYIYKLGKIAPRSYFASDIVPVDSDKVLDAEELPDFDRSRQVLIDHDSLDASGQHMPIPQNGEGSAADPSSASVAITHYSDNEVTIDADVSKHGVVVLHDLFYPGWEVRVDGIQKPVLRANLLFRGVEVNQGHHRIEFSFHPLSLANLSAAISTVVAKHED